MWFCFKSIKLVKGSPQGRKKFAILKNAKIRINPSEIPYLHREDCKNYRGIRAREKTNKIALLIHTTRPKCPSVLYLIT